MPEFLFVNAERRLDTTEGNDVPIRITFSGLSGFVVQMPAFHWVGYRDHLTEMWTLVVPNSCGCKQFLLLSTVACRFY